MDNLHLFLESAGTFLIIAGALHGLLGILLFLGDWKNQSKYRWFTCSMIAYALGTILAFLSV